MISVALQVLGSLLLAFGLWMLTPWLGVTVGGALILTMGVALELGMRNRDGTSRPSDS